MKSDKKNVAPEKRLIALILIYLFGIFGAHRFYVGKNATAIIQIAIFIGNIIFAIKMIENPVYFLPLIVLTIFFLIWILIDMITILLGKFENSNGEKLINWT